MDQNINGMNNKLTPINIYLDLSKAFDILDRKILVSKQKYFGVQGVSLDLFKKYIFIMLSLITRNRISMKFTV